MDIMLCDDHLLFVQALTTVLQAQGWVVVACVSAAADVVATARRLRPDLCLLDIHFPDASGLDLIAPLIEASPGTKVVMLSASVDRELMALALGAGVSGYLSKSQDAEQMIGMLGRIQAGELVLQGQSGLLAGTRLPRDAPEQLVTARELEVLHCLQEGLSTAGIARRLGITSATARSHVQNLLRKLGVHSQLEAVAYAAARSGSALPRPPAA